MRNSGRLTVLRLALGGVLTLWVLATIATYRVIQELGVNFSPASQLWMMFLGMIFICSTLLILLALTGTRLKYSFFAIGSWLVQHLPANPRWAGGLLGFVILAFSFGAIFPWGFIFGQQAFLWLSFGIVVIFSALLLRRLWPQINWLNLLTLAMLIAAAGYRIFQFLPEISHYPFSLSWSETSRFYYASLFFSKRIYGFQVSPSTLHPSRYLLQSLPFLFGELSLWFHRMWQVLLWFGGFLGTAALLARRLKITSRAWWWIFAAWVFLFLWQGPVYYHLLVTVMIVLWGFKPNRFGYSLIVVIIASLWAGISRLNWFPVPGMLAAMLYFVEYPQSEKSTWKYLTPPILWAGIGLGIALAAQSLYILWSGNDPEHFASSFSSALLWYRLLPNSTYPLGVLTGTILVTFPTAWLVQSRLKHAEAHLSPIAGLGLIAILGVLFAGGLVVSTKIGGGGNLHNVDAYLTLLMIVGSYFYFNRIAPHTPARPISPSINFVLVLIPVYFALSGSIRITQYQPQVVADTLQRIQEIVDDFTDKNSEVLLIAERHLITFDYLNGIKLVPEYEKVFLMEMVMAGNQPYLNTFKDDIRSKRFDLIITDTLYQTRKDRGESWAEENNVWVEGVSDLVLCYYRQEAVFPEPGIQILRPYDHPKDCPWLSPQEQE